MAVAGGGQGAGSNFLARTQRRNSVAPTGAAVARAALGDRHLGRVGQIECDLRCGRVAVTSVDFKAMQDDLLQPQRNGV